MWRIIVALMLALTTAGLSASPVMADAWTTKTPMTAARSTAAAGVINGILYVAGGHDGVTGGTPTLQAYNPATDTWSTLAAMPGRRYNGDGAGVINGELYVAGGWNYPDSGLPTSSLFIYNPGTNSWRSAASMPTLSGEGASGVINGKLYVTTATNGYSGWRDFLHVYDPGTNSWSSLASSPNVHDAPAFGVIDGKFYVAGGGGASGALSNKLDVYDPTTNTWSTKASMPAAGLWFASGVFNGKLYVIGGTAGGIFYNTVYVYDPASDTWTTETSMSTARAGAAAGVINGVIYVAGGAISTGPLATVEALTPGSVAYSITATAGANGSISPSGAVGVDQGANQTFTITPNTGYHVADVLVDGGSVGAVSSYTFTTVTANHTIAASFAINTYAITASAGANGTISPSGVVTVNYGANQSFTITPNTGYHIVDVLVDGSSVGAVSSYTFSNVTANHTIAASFAINTYAITASAGANGAISPSGAAGVDQGANQTFTITPNTGYHIADVLVDGSSVGAVSSYTFTTVTANHIIAASFAINNQPPFALFSYSPETPQVNQKVTFNASATYDPDGTIVSYGWEFGDGGIGTGVTAEHTYTNANEYSVILTVTDNSGATNTKTITVTVAQTPPTAPQGRRSLPDPSTLVMVGSGLAVALFYIGLSGLRRRLNRD